jgi:VanZ family protein
VAGVLATIVALILYVTLTPFDFSFTSGNAVRHLIHAWPNRLGWAFARDAAINVGLFIPLGVAACVTYARYWRRGTAVAATLAHGAILSFGIEVLQYYEVARYSSLSDLVFNSMGTLIGAWLGLIYQRRIEGIARTAWKRGAPAGVLLAACWLTSQFYPFVPILRSGQFSRGWARLISAPISWVEVAGSAAGWFVFALALRAIWGKLPWAWFALCVLAVPARMVIWDRALTQSELAGAFLALALWLILSESYRPGVGWVLMVAAVVLRELAPFDFGGAEHSFSWIPFGASMAAEHASGVAVLGRKAFEYGSLVWMLQAGKFRPMVAGVLVAIGLFGMEMMQTRMPGRLPEITDALIALLMGLVLKLLA